MSASTTSRARREKVRTATIAAPPGAPFLVSDERALFEDRGVMHAGRADVIDYDVEVGFQ
ncbi:MAG: hypothetical protein ACYCUM_09615 [Solirubrobacteraceae bacterium]